MNITTGKVVIIGAGMVGSTAAYALQISGVAREIVLVDADEKRAAGEAEDLSHGAFFTPSVKIRSGSYEECANADVVAICAGAGQKPGQTRMELVETNIAICKTIVENVAENTTDAIIVVVTNPVDVLTYAALRHSRFPANQVIGSGTVLDSARFRYLISQHCNVDPHNVHAYVLGEHGDSEVMAWSLTTLGGVKLDEFCCTCPKNCEHFEYEIINEKVKNSAYHIIEAKGATNFAVGLALVRIVTAIMRNENSVLTVSTLMHGEFGIEDVCMSVQAIVNKSGVKRVICPKLTPEEIEALRASANAIKNVQQQVGL